MVSARARGIALQGLKRKRETLKRYAVKVALGICGRTPFCKPLVRSRRVAMAEAVVAGFLLWLVHT